VGAADAVDRLFADQQLIWDDVSRRWVEFRPLGTARSGAGPGAATTGLDRGENGDKYSGGVVMRRFEGKVALVTAAAQGIGQAVVRRVAAEGGAVVVTDLRKDAVAAPAEEVGAEYALGFKVDVTSRADVDAAVAAAIGRFGRLDLVVNNAGSCVVTSMPEDTSAEDWHRQLDITLVSAARCIQAAIPHLVKTRGNGPNPIDLSPPDTLHKGL
jgi:hypothetical protein